jgi:branched-subunit amino acid ABC-type transport system permease component
MDNNYLNNERFYVKRSNGVGIAGFVLSLISLVLSWVPGVGWFVWFLGFILSFCGMFKSPRGLAVAGFLISIIDLIILIAAFGALASILSVFI